MFAEGSSQRMRGAQLPCRCSRVVRRIIPADAGSTVVGVFVLTDIKDHPRGCGEHSARISPWLRGSGSSPRMRGAPMRNGRQSYGSWIIPADAGSTRRSRNPKGLHWDHPRGCGEHPVPSFSMRASCGSSPRMRGARGVQVCGLQGYGIIPADAGSTDTCCCSHTTPRDHPRGCGEH